MLGDVVDKAGEGVGTAMGGAEGVAGGFINLMLSPYGLVGLVLILLLVRATR